MTDSFIVPPTESQCRDAAWESYAIITVDEKGKIVHATAKAEQIFGYPIRGSLKRLDSVDQLVALEFQGDHPKLRAQHQKSPSQKVMNGGRVVMGRKQDGTEFPVTVILNSQYINDKLYTQAVLADATESIPLLPMN